MPHTTRTNAVEVVTTGPLTKAEVRHWLDDCDRAGIDDDTPVAVRTSALADSPSQLMARTDFGTGPMPGYGYPTAEPPTERLLVPLRPDDRAAYLLNERMIPGTVVDVTGDLVEWRSDGVGGLNPMTVKSHRRDFVPLGLPGRPSIGGLQP